MEYSKGNWILHIGGYCHSIVGPNGMKVHVTWGDNYPHEGKANARVMAASRELFESLERCIEIMENGGTWTLEDQINAHNAISLAKLGRMVDDS